MTTFVERQEKQKRSRQRAAELRLKNNRLGMNIFQVSWIMAFLAMIIVNWQLRFSYTTWPPEGVTLFDPLLPSIATFALLISATLVGQSLNTLRSGQIEAFLGRWRLAIALGILFMIIIIYEFFSASDAAMATQYGITFRLMTGFHLVHALAIALVMLRVYQQSVLGSYGSHEHDSWAVEGTVKLWHFVTFAWLLFYVVLYWIR